MKQSGVYVITCMVTGKRYVGSSVDIERRRKTHFRLLEQGRHHSEYLQRAYSKYGQSAFVFNVLEGVLPERKLLLEREQHWMDTLKPEYNLTLLAGSHLGVKRSPEAIERMRTAQSNPEVRKRKSEATKGKKRPEHVVERLREANTGKNLSEETKKKLSQHFTGRKLTKKPVRIQPISEITRLKYSVRTKRLWDTGILTGHSEATKQKISKTLTGRKLTGKQRQQRSESMKEVWRKRKNGE